MSAVPEALFVSPSTPIGRSEGASKHDLGFARHVLAGLAAKRKSIRIDELGDGVAFGSVEASRMEALILRQCSRQIVATADPDASVIDVEDGASPSTALLRAALDRNSNETEGACKRLFVLLPGRMGRTGPVEGVRFLRELAEHCGTDSLLVVGAALPSPGPALAEIDTDSPRAEEAAQALFRRINEELGGDFDPGEFGHEVSLDAKRQCAEARMVSRKVQAVRVLGRTFRFAAGEPIHLATSYRYSVARFESLVVDAGWQHCQLWSDGQARYAVHVLERSRRNGRLSS